ncbi:LOW QUALITY PROTEIN: hypothetical protein Cgig2_027192 [Carnegiea gigantea]|uniref:Uncharacterized protein n=1 Tax=Carnegiea gigantea TaxID=171969 RepID=A0A9Q1QR18_9CARY|nr:LOW QUALITY PROTEIN: hypothetical protein Cgig2_027192 [Carnegiea gigantea]
MLLFVWIVLSGLFFSWMSYGAAWCPERYAFDVCDRISALYESLRMVFVHLEKENRKSLDKEVEKLAFHVRHLADYRSTKTCLSNCKRITLRLLQMVRVGYKLLMILIVQMSISSEVRKRQPTMSIVKELPVEHSAEEVVVVEVLLSEDPTINVAKPEHQSAEVLPFVDPVVEMSGDIVHFTANVHVTDTEVSYDDDDGESVQVDEGDSKEPQWGQSESVEDVAVIEIAKVTVKVATSVRGEQQPGEGDKDVGPCSMIEAGIAEVESVVEEGGESPLEEEVVVVSNDNTDRKLMSTVADWFKQRPRTGRAPRFHGSLYVILTNRHGGQTQHRGSSTAHLGKCKDDEGMDVQDVGDIPPTTKFTLRWLHMTAILVYENVFLSLQLLIFD